MPHHALLRPRSIHRFFFDGNRRSAQSPISGHAFAIQSPCNRNTATRFLKAMKQSDTHKTGLRGFTIVGALSLAALMLAGCSTPEQIQRRKLKTVDERRDISLAYVGSCRMKTIADTCVDFYANINTTMRKFALKNCEIVEEPCDRMAATTICLSPAQKGDALIQYEFIFPPNVDAAVLEKECNPSQKREVVRL